MTCPDCGEDHPPLLAYLTPRRIGRIDDGVLSLSAGVPDEIARALRAMCDVLPRPDYDPDYDITGPLDAIDDHIAYEQRVAGDYRAIRQTEAWKYPPAKPDPTAILDEP